MTGVTSSFHAERHSNRANAAVILQANTAAFDSQIGNRALLRTAVSLASLMAASAASAQEGGSSGLTLPTIDVSGANQETGYQATQQTITRLPTALIDTPQTVNVVTQQLIKDQRFSSMEDALRSVPGITFSAGEGGQQGDGPIIRGFVARGDLFRDGIRDPGWYTRDLFAADRVEVYKGPSAFAFGRGSTGGAINTVTKLPTGDTFVEGTVTGTTGPGVRAELDAGGQQGNISGRIAALGMDMDTPTRDYVNTRRWGIAPSIAAKLSDNDKLTLSYIYQGEDGVPDYGFTYLPQPAYSKTTGKLTNLGYYGNGAPTPPLPISRDTFLGLPSDTEQTETHILTAKLEHEFDNGTKLVNASRYIYNDRFSIPTAPRALGGSNNIPFGQPGAQNPTNYPIDQMTYGRERRQRDTLNTLLINQTDFLAKFTTWSLEHTFATGIEIARETREQNRIDLCDPTNIACRSPIIAPSPNGSPTDGTLVNYLPVNTVSTNQAAYLADQIKINRYVELLASLRYDRFDTDYSDPNQTVVANRNLGRLDNLFSYRFGAVYHPATNVSIYVAYGNSYNPSAELGTLTNASVANLAPEQTHTLEGGVKVDLADGRLSLTGSVFRIEKMNLRITDPTDSTVSILSGIARVDGVELGAVGKITDKWSVFAGYSYLKSIILDTPDLSILNRQLPSTPANNFTLWTSYDITPQWTIGGGATFQSLAYANTGNTAYVPSYWKFDAMLNYKVDKNSTLQFNIYNITDKLYYAQYFGNNVVPASGRWASLTYRYRW
jgi:catecholate siderophore receptor